MNARSANHARIRGWIAARIGGIGAVRHPFSPHELHKECPTMPNHVCNCATLTCSFGLAPSQLAVLPANRMMTSSQPAATVMDHKPLVNILPFGACTSLANPAVAAATSAAFGVLTPQPCIPVTVTPWAPGAATVLLGNQPSLDNVSTLNCLWGGVIQVAAPGQFRELIP